jgi:predicted nucleic acid-binding protein
VLTYLDSVIVIYLIEQPPVFGARAATKVGAILANGDRLAVSDVVRLECRVGPLMAGNATRLAEFDAFFASPDVQVVPVTTAVFDRAALIRARHRFRLADSLNLAAAVEAGCGALLTNDQRLSRFPDVPVEVLP